MNKLKFSILLMLGLILTVFYACNEDEFTELEQKDTLQNNEIQHRFDQLQCGFVESFCTRKDLYTAVSIVEGGGGTKAKVGRKTYEVQPFQMYNGAKGLALIESGRVYVGHKCEDVYLSSKNVSTNFPDELAVLINTQLNGVFVPNTGTTTEIGGIKPSGGGSITGKEIDLTGVNTDGICIDWVLECDYTLVSNVSDFVDVFFVDGDQSHIVGFIEDAFHSCPAAYPDHNPYYDVRCENDCIDPRCVVDNLLAIEQGLSDDQKERIVARYLGEVMGLTDAEENWIALGEEDLLFEIYNGLENTQNLGRCGAEDCGMLGGYHEMIIQEQAGANLTTEDKESLLEFFSIMRCDDNELYDCFREAQQDPDGEVAAFLDQIKVALMTDNLALLGGCDDLGQYESRWYDLTDLNPLEVPGISEKLEELGDEYWIQTLENAYTPPPIPPTPPTPPHYRWWTAPPPAVNMDFFGITIDALPNNPDTGEPFNSESFFDYIQQNWTTPEFLGLGNGCGATFLPISQVELTNWTDGNGLGSTFTIKMPDDGNVICVEHDPGNHWIFATLNAPGWFEGDSWDGFHPVSGNREFGIIGNADGTFTFYTSGVDRLTGFWHDMADPAIDQFGSGSAFEQADEVWNCLLNTIAGFVNTYGGSAVTKNYDCTTIRPKWEELREVVKNGCSGFTDALDEFPCEQAIPCQ